VATVSFPPLGRAAEAKANETVLDAARRAAVPLGNSCGGVGICARCRVRVVEGPEALAPMTSVETRVTQQRGFGPDERLACQAVVQGDCAVTTSYW
jgi:2Fe-2S ferredoxin